MHRHSLGLLLILFSYIANAQVYNAEQKIIWGYGVDQFYNAKVLPSGKIVLLGRTDSHRNGGYQNKDGWAVMLSLSGDTLWSKSYGGRSRTDRFWDMEQMPNKDLLFIGSSGSFLGSENVYVVRTDSTGKLLESFNYGDKGFDTAEDIELLKDGGWIMIGKSKSGLQNSDYPFHILLIRCDSNGEPIWMKKIESEGESYGIKTLITEDDDIYILGNVKINNRIHITLHCYNSDGEMKLAKTYKGKSLKGEGATDMILGMNGTILISGYSTGSVFSGLLMEVDRQGKVKNSREYCSSENLNFMRITQDSDTSLWLVGFYSEDSISSSGPVIKLSKDFQVLKARQFRPLDDNVYFSTIRILSDKQMLLVGSHTLHDGAKRGGYISIIDKEGSKVPYEKTLPISDHYYPLEAIEVEFHDTKTTGHSPVQSLVIPVPLEEFKIK